MGNHTCKHKAFQTGITLLVLFFTGRTHAQQEPDFEIPKTHIEVRVHPPDAVPKPDLLPEDARRDGDAEKPEDPVEALHHEMETLRDEIRMLQATLDLMINNIMEDLREENALLRKEVQRLNAMQERYGLPDMSQLPRPGSGLFDEVLSDEHRFEQEHPETDEEAQYTDEPFVFMPLHEWGRTPEAAEDIGGDAPSLLGMVGVVPRNSRRADIEQLGRELRAHYDGYDNINIEVFDDAAAAEKFIETQVGDPARRVLSISKHRGEGRDVILFLKNGEAHEVTPLEE